MSLSYHDWFTLYQENSEPDIVIEKIEGTVKEEEPESENEQTEDAAEASLPGTPEEPENNDALVKMKELCRVCLSKGFISISSHLTPKLFTLRASGDMTPWQVPISKIISEVSGEKVNVDDGYPQFICQHCLGYLQHAYGMKLKIKANKASLDVMKELATNESIALDQKIDIKRVTKREVEQTKEEEHEEGHFYKVFRDSNIQINGQSRASMERIIEQKCVGCGARLMSVKSLNEHMQNCENVAVNSFFSTLKDLYTLQSRTQITNIEFVHRAFRLIFDTTKNLQKIARAKGINVSAVSSEMPKLDAENEQFDTRVNNLRRNYSTKSPDNGYQSGGSPNYAQRL